MRVRLLSDPDEFLAAARALLLADEARHNLILGIASTLREHPQLYPEARLWLVEDRGEPLAAALRTPPHRLVLARPRTGAALRALVGGIDDVLPGVVGAVPEIDRFLEGWTERSGAREARRRRQGVYALERVVPVEGVAGHVRRAVPADRPLLVEWTRLFAAEALGEVEADPEHLERAVAYRLDGGSAGFVLWEDAGEPVSVAGFGGTTPNGIRIGPVYTPPERRGRGYASALVAQVSADQLAAGRRFCFLYTDLANAVANRIYERIGYERVCESAEVDLAPA